ncbi:MAG: tripartite tricarboxylate transporter substrate binding protein [Burkholderiales bacterium]|nr:tripartite tricarboxylate transporter substrate binding protein [Burkholderiales bacterium]
MIHAAVATLVAGLTGLLPAPARAADAYPSKTVRFIVPFTPSGPVDMLARLVGGELSKSLGQQFVVENRPGANGIVGTELAARATPDGYTLLLGNVGPIAVNVSLYKKLAYDPVRDFAPIAMVARSPQVLVAHPSLPASSIRQLIDLAKSRPGQLHYGSPGVGSGPQLTMELFKETAGKLDIVHVPYKGIAPALTDALGGQISLVITNVVPVQNMIATGRLKPLAVTSRERSPILPRVPTMIESGLAGFEAIGWFGVLAPAGTPGEIVAKLNQEIGRAQGLPAFRDQLAALGSEAWRMTPEAFGALIRSDVEKWRKFLRESKLSLD